MNKIKVMSIFGTRPEATKMAPLINTLEKNENIESIVCVTAQHRQMLDQVLNIFNIKPDFDLNIMKENQSLSDITINALRGLENVIKDVKPNLILVHGDTTTTFAGGLAAYYNKVKLGHVEAGLRTYDKHQPFPEEMNRLLVGGLADIHFSPTYKAKENLIKENIDTKNIFVTGNTAVDCLKTTVLQNYKFELQCLNNIDFKNKKIIAMTAHRRENLGEPLKNICKAVLKITEDFKDVEVVYAVHSNPAVGEIVQSILGNNIKIHLTDPINMNDMHNLINMSYLVLTDSGGLQEEAPGLNKPVVVLRNVTERPEGVEAGTLKLAGTDYINIYETVASIINNKELYNKMANAKNPFGDGYASERIVDAILYYFGIKNERPDDYFVL